MEKVQIKKLCGIYVAQTMGLPSILFVSGLILAGEDQCEALRFESEKIHCVHFLAVSYHSIASQSSQMQGEYSSEGAEP